jgi:DNA-binding CsgD family transcriptional regulator
MRIYNRKTIDQVLKPSFSARMIIVYVVLFSFHSVYSQDTIINSGGIWKYFDKGTIDIENISLLKAKNIDWPEGETPIGFGQRDEATVINNIIEEKDSILNYFVFQKKINIHNIDEYKTFLLRLVRDDGAVVYVNNKEVIRSNLPDGHISAKTRASTLVSGIAEYTFYEYFVSPSYFQKGENVITVILFQFRNISSDCRFDLELFAYKNYEILNSLIYNINSDRKLLEHELELYAVERMLNEKTDEIKFLNLEYLTNKNIFLIIIGLLAVTIILLIVFLTISWKKNHNLILKHRLLEKETEDKSKELINISLSLLKIKQFVSSLLGNLQSIQKEADQKQQIQIEKLINRIEFHKHYEEDWERLKMHFDTIHSGFFARLKDKYPELTQSELRHCTYIKLQMFTSEIAQMLNIDNKSVQASRYRIKKKMQLPQNVDLKNFLEDF